MTRRKITKSMYEKYLDEVGKSLSSEEFIIGGKQREGRYGYLLRKYNPIAFEAGYYEWANNYI